MPKYQFTGGYPRVLSGLQQGVNARHEGTPPGATVEVFPGDTVETDAPYANAELVEVDPAAPAPAPAPEPAPEPAPVQGDVVLTPEEIAHLSPEVLAQIHAAEQAAQPNNPGAPAPAATQE